MERYRADLETYLDLFEEGYVDFDMEKHARDTTTFTVNEERLVKVCFSVIERMRENWKSALQEERTSIEFDLRQEFKQDFYELEEERDDLKQELSLYQNFYEAVSVNMRFLISNSQGK